MRGLFITFEGGDGSGKTTQIELLTSWLEEQKETVVVTREPGGTDLGNELRQLVMHRKGFIAPRAEALMYAADRSHHVQTVVRPALERGEIVVQDRYLDSSIAYQGAGRVLDVDEIRNLSVWATEGLVPDLTILLDVSADVARLRRLKASAAFDRLEAENENFHNRVRESYLALAKRDPARWLVVDGEMPVQQIHSEILAKLALVLG